MADSTFIAVAFIDPRRYARRAFGRARERYLALLADSRFLAPCIDAELASDVCACDASIRARTASTGEGWVAAGEAAFSIDPLSSQGLHVALTSGVQASAVARTVLRAPSRSELAYDFYEDQCREAVARNLEVSSVFYAKQAALTPTAFWEARARVGQAARPSLAELSALDLGRPVRLTSPCRLIKVAVMEDDMIVERPALSHPALREPAAFVGGVAADEIVRAAAISRTGGELLASLALSGCSSPARLVSWLWETGLLRYSQ